MIINKQSKQLDKNMVLFFFDQQSTDRGLIYNYFCYFLLKAADACHVLCLRLEIRAPRVSGENEEKKSGKFADSDKDQLEMLKLKE